MLAVKVTNIAANGSKTNCMNWDVQQYQVNGVNIFYDIGQMFGVIGVAEIVGVR